MGRPESALSTNEGRGEVESHVLTDVYVWHYTLLVVIAIKEEKKKE